MIVQAIPFLLERGHGAGFAAFAVGLMGASQIPGRLLFGLVALRLPAVFALVAAGIAVIVSVDGTVAVLAGMVVLGMGSGMAILARATVVADRYGAEEYGAIAGVLAAVTTAARAVGPIAGAAWAAAVGYPALLWTLAGLAALAVLLAVAAERFRARRGGARLDGRSRRGCRARRRGRPRRGRRAPSPHSACPGRSGRRRRSPW